MTWQMVDEGWGRKAVDFATLAEPTASREYVAVHHHLGIEAGDRVLDMACGSGLALELARVRGAVVSGIDASPRLVAVAADRNPGCDIRVGDMGELPWPDASFDVVTSFRGIWGTTPAAVREAHRVLVPGGRLAFTVWGNVSKSPGKWMFEPFLWATDEKVQHQADMNALGHPGVGEAFLAEAGFDVARALRDPLRARVRGSRHLRASDRGDRTLLRVDGVHRRGRVPGASPSARRRARPRRVAAARGRSRSSATSAPSV